jgi:hypothetical protein
MLAAFLNLGQIAQLVGFRIQEIDEQSDPAGH